LKHAVHTSLDERHLCFLGDVHVPLIVKSVFLVEVGFLLARHFFLLSPLSKIICWSFLFLIFQLRSLFFWYLILFLNHFVKVLFVFNSNLLYIIFFQFDPCWLISKFFPCPVCESFIVFQFYHLIQFYGVLFF
jgi:hypothetical protein